MSRKGIWRIVPLCFPRLIVAYIDRADQGHTALELNAEPSLCP